MNMQSRRPGYRELVYVSLALLVCLVVLYFTLPATLIWWRAL